MNDTSARGEEFRDDLRPLASAPGDIAARAPAMPWRGECFRRTNSRRWSS